MGAACSGLGGAFAVVGFVVGPGGAGERARLVALAAARAGDCSVRANRGGLVLGEELGELAEERRVGVRAGDLGGAW
jgi:hypothetical protein